MATGLLNSAGADLDTILAPINGATPISNVGIQDTAGNDIATLFRDVAAGTAPVANTGFQNSLAADIKTLFAEIGTVPPLLAVDSTFTPLAQDLTNPGSVRCEIIFEVDGDVINNSSTTSSSGGPRADAGDWVADKTGLSSSDFQYNATLTFGDVPSGTVLHGNTNTWTTFSSELSFYLSSSLDDTVESCTVALQIREIGNTTNIVSTDITLNIQIGTP